MSVIDAGKVASVPVKLPFFSYEDERITFHLGWQMHGDFTAKLNINNSPIQISVSRRCDRLFGGLRHTCRLSFRPNRWAFILGSLA